MYGDSVVVGSWEAFLDAEDTEDEEPISPSGFSLDFPVCFESLSAPADFVELGFTWLRNGVEWAFGSDLKYSSLILMNIFYFEYTLYLEC